MIGQIKGASAAVIYDNDTPEIIVQKMLSARYLIDMRTDITNPLEDIVQRYYAQKKKQEQEQQQKKQEEPKKPNRRFF